MALYCAEHLPNFIKNTDGYKSGDVRQGLIDAFLGFDALLAKPDIVEVLKELAGAPSKKPGNVEDSGIIIIIYISMFFSKKL